MHSFTGQGTQTTIWNNHVVLRRLAVEGTTDSGYIAAGAPIRYQYKEDQFKYLVAQTFRNPSTGDIFQARIRVMEKGGEPAWSSPRSGASPGRLPTGPSRTFASSRTRAPTGPGRAVTSNARSCLICG
jgi:hypothetical protein